MRPQLLLLLFVGLVACTIISAQPAGDPEAAAAADAVVHVANVAAPQDGPAAEADVADVHNTVTPAAAVAEASPVESQEPGVATAQAAAEADPQPAFFVPTRPALQSVAPVPTPGRRFIVALEPDAPADRRSAVRDLVRGSSGRVALESEGPNPFIVFEANSAAEAASIARLAASAKGVRYVEEDVVRYHASRPLPVAEQVHAAVRKLQQATPMQPYGLGMVEANLFTTAQRSTTSPLNATAKFPICIIDSGIDATHPALQGLSHIGEPTGAPTAAYTTDWCAHGTHVAGTIAADTTLDSVLPGAVDLVSIKVFGDNCAWVYASTLANAINRCVALGARVISMSLGGGSSSSTEEAAVNTAYSQGVLLFAAAGNSGNTVVSFPAGYANCISVAAIDSNSARASFSQYNSDVELAAPGVGVLSSVYAMANIRSSAYPNSVYGGDFMESTPRNNFSARAVRCTNSGSITTCPSTSTSGRVCIIQRITSVTPCTQVAACTSRGGVAAIISNTVNRWWTASVASCKTIPVLAVPSTTRNYLTTGATVSVSSWQYAFYAGTSMATPHASAVAALVWANNPTCNNTVIRCTLQRSAEDLGAAGRDTEYGFGLIKAKQASDWLQANGCTCTTPAG